MGLSTPGSPAFMNFPEFERENLNYAAGWKTLVGDDVRPVDRQTRCGVRVSPGSRYLKARTITGQTRMILRL